MLSHNKYCFDKTYLLTYLEYLVNTSGLARGGSKFTATLITGVAIQDWLTPTTKSQDKVETMLVKKTNCWTFKNTPKSFKSRFTKHKITDSSSLCKKEKQGQTPTYGFSYGTVLRDYGRK